MRLAIFGGSFNPVHLAHLALAADALETFSYDRILFIPSFRPPHKEGVELATPEDRLAMLAAAVEGDRRFQVDDCEIRRQGLSYTFDTIDEVERRYRPDGKIGFLLGDDLVDNYPSWKRADELAARTDLILARRSAGKAPRFEYPHLTLENPFLDISSTKIRERIAEGRSWAFMMPRGAASIVVSHSLYGHAGRENRTELPSGMLPNISDALERFARTTMPSSRFIHSRGVALLAAQLCVRFGLDPERGYLAGISHDTAKGLDDGEIRALALADGGGESDLEASCPALLHARAASVLLRQRFGVDDAEILEAVASHTFGSAGMGKLARVVYIADKLEPSRQQVPVALRDLAKTASLESLLAAVLAEKVRQLGSQGKPVFHGTLGLLADVVEDGCPC